MQVKNNEYDIFKAWDTAEGFVVYLMFLGGNQACDGRLRQARDQGWIGSTSPG
jgi:hypothetical protein